MKDEVKEHTHEQRRGMESPTGVPNPPPKESVEQVRARMNIAWRMRASRKNSGKLLGSSSLNTTPPTATHVLPPPIPPQLKEPAEPDSARRLTTATPVLTPPISPQETEAKDNQIAGDKSRKMQEDIHGQSAPTGTILSNQAAANHPQPVDYGLTYDALDRNNLRTAAGLEYKESPSWKFFLPIWLLVYSLGFAVLATSLRGTVGEFVLLFFVGLIVGGGLTALYIYPILSAAVSVCIAAYERRHPSAGLLAYRQALHLHELYLTAAREAEWAARQAAHEAELRKRSYWEFLDGYAFERATAEVLSKHQFNAVVTSGSGDGGVDIEVTRNGRKGVVQCKAHTSGVGPHVVRDLYGVIHHSRASFGIIVSRGGFSRGAVEFARDKPIYFLDVSHLIAMQEGRDVLAEAFTRTET